MGFSCSISVSKLVRQSMFFLTLALVCSQLNSSSHSKLCPTLLCAHPSLSTPTPTSNRVFSISLFVTSFSLFLLLCNGNTNGSHREIYSEIYRLPFTSHTSSSSSPSSSSSSSSSFSSSSSSYSSFPTHASAHLIRAPTISYFPFPSHRFLPNPSLPD